MGLLPDWMIRRGIKIDPYCDGQTRPGIISYGLSSYGYDVRVGWDFKIFTNVHGSVVDPKNFCPKSFVNVYLNKHGEHEFGNDLECLICGLKAVGESNLERVQSVVRLQEQSDCVDHILIPPNSFALAESVEHFEIPRDVLAICLGKSTYARCGIIVNITPLEPEWRGKITIEISNTTPLPAKVYANEGIAQILFLQTENVCDVSYADKKGVYQDQAGVVGARVRQ